MEQIALLPMYRANILPMYRARSEAVVVRGATLGAVPVLLLLLLVRVRVSVLMLVGKGVRVGVGMVVGVVADPEWFHRHYQHLYLRPLLPDQQLLHL